MAILWSSASEKLAYNKAHFDEAAGRYDLATVGLSLGQDCCWKRKLVQKIRSVESPHCLDLACGTGDITFLLKKRFPKAKVIGIDVSQRMLKLAAARAKVSDIEFSEQDMCNLRFDDESFEIITGGYALRNAPNLNCALSEIRRLLKPDGRAYFLEFAKSDSMLMQKLQYSALKFWGSFWGLMLHLNVSIHGYLGPSFREFPAKSALAEAITGQKLTITERHPLFFGMVEVITIEKNKQN